MDINTNRDFMKANFTDLDGFKTDQELKKQNPALSKDYASDNIIKLPEITQDNAPKADLFQSIVNRKSKRKFKKESISIDELAYLLYTTQGVKFVNDSRKYSMRTVPSGGARHPFETYLAIHRVEGVEPGVYYYEPFEHQLVHLFTPENMIDTIAEASLGQRFVGDCAVTFIWSCIPYRCEWRYHTAAHKTMLLDAGHLCQNLYLACEAISCGTCAIGAYDQELMDKFLNLSGDDEFVVYLSPVGKI